MQTPFDDPRWKSIERRLKEIYTGSALDLQAHSGEIALLEAEQSRIEQALGQTRQPPRRRSGMA